MVRLPDDINLPLSTGTYTTGFCHDLLRTLLKSHHEAARKFVIEEVLVNEDEDIATIILDAGEGIIFGIDIYVHDSYARCWALGCRGGVAAVCKAHKLKIR